MENLSAFLLQKKLRIAKEVSSTHDPVLLAFMTQGKVSINIKYLHEMVCDALLSECERNRMFVSDFVLSGASNSWVDYVDELKRGRAFGPVEFHVMAFIFNLNIHLLSMEDPMTWQFPRIFSKSGVSTSGVEHSFSEPFLIVHLNSQYCACEKILIPNVELSSSQCRENATDLNGTADVTIVSLDESSIFAQNLCGCGRTFANFGQFKYHIRNCKGKENSVPAYRAPPTTKLHCEICQGAFKTLPNLRQHFLRKHKDTSFTCSTCTKSFQLEKDLKYHQKFCGVTSFLCCGFTFISRRKLAIHKRGHLKK
eukprot:Pompholyxophrys_punicea_v1_NODE_228_length_2676_cov_112.645555.p2 type:complete len:310 gc:universal NODE_228_length_2676_cov_112.645555:1440-2369(+)